MKKSIEDLPPELMNQVVEHLSYYDLADLRISSRRLSCLTTQDKFKSFCVCKHLRLNVPSLQAFVRATQPGQPGCLLQDLTLCGEASNAECISDLTDFEAEDLRQSQKDLSVVEKLAQQLNKPINESKCTALLSEAFQNLARSGQRGRLRTLTLKVVVATETKATPDLPAKEVDWRVVWSAATICFRTLVAALGHSKLPLENLDLFTTVNRCSLALTEIEKVRHTASDGLRQVFRDLKSLSISMSRPAIENHISAAHECQSRNGGPKHERLMPNLERLHYHWYSIDGVPELTDSLYRKAQSELAYRRIRCSHLKDLTLQGTIVSEAKLLWVLQNRPIRRLTLEHVHMARRKTFGAIFDNCTSEAAAMEYLCFDTISERFTVQFEGMEIVNGVQKRKDSAKLIREGAEVRKDIRYHRNTSVAGADTPEAKKAEQEFKLKYGPP